jgi:two-component system, OmpR family, sensor histidine kinase VicK
VALLDNAAKFSPKGSQIGLEAELDGGEMLVSVLDRGDGVPEKEREKIFDRFYQMGDAEHHSVPGIGLGLYISKQIVIAHGGRIWHEPREGGGSIIRFSLPM